MLQNLQLLLELSPTRSQLLVVVAADAPMMRTH
jgi:hypothetical protein